MDITICPRKLYGKIPAVASKSHVQRLLICAALADRPTQIICNIISRDIQATADCLTAIGAGIERSGNGYRVTPIQCPTQEAILPCAESGATLRFLLPVVGALGIEATFAMEGRLAKRPLSPLWETMQQHGCSLRWTGENQLRCSGQLKSGSYTIAGDISSQFLSGLWMAFPLMDGTSSLEITGKIASKSYFDMTKQVVAQFCHGNRYQSPGTVKAEGDWSSAAFFLGANALGCQITVTGLDENSIQGDKAITSLLSGFSQVDTKDIPDLVPILSVIASQHGALFTNIGRLRLKESDRVASIRAMLKNLGIATEATENTLTVHAGKIFHGTIDSCGDHRIAMSAAIAATCADGPVTILGANCVEKSYPGFWEDYKTLGGYYEFHIR